MAGPGLFTAPVCLQKDPPPRPPLDMWPVWVFGNKHRRPTCIETRVQTQSIRKSSPDAAQTYDFHRQVVDTACKEYSQDGINTVPPYPHDDDAEDALTDRLRSLPVKVQAFLEASDRVDLTFTYDVNVLSSSHLHPIYRRLNHVVINSGRSLIHNCRTFQLRAMGPAAVILCNETTQAVASVSYHDLIATQVRIRSWHLTIKGRNAELTCS